MKSKLKKIMVEQVKNYLHFKGWQQDEKIEKLGTIWHRPEIEFSAYEIILPESNDFKDYTDRILDIISNLSQVEEQKTEDILNDLMGFFFDKISIRILHDDVEDGSVPVEDGVLLIKNARELISAATLSAIYGKGYYAGKRPNKAIEYLSSIKLGQTETGSFIVNLISPLEFKKKSNLFVSEENLFSREVTNKLVGGLSALVNCLGDNDISDLSESIKKGLSANLCDAIVEISGFERKREVRISISFSAKVKKEQNIPNEFVFKKKDIQGIEKVSDTLKMANIFNNHVISGNVIDLRRGVNQMDGTIIVPHSINGTTRHVNIYLEKEEYEEAITAHKEQKGVECTGELHLYPRKSTLFNPRDFKILG